MVHGRYDAGPDAVTLDTVRFLEPWVLEQVVDERGVVAVHGGTEEADEREDVDEDHVLGPFVGRLLDKGLVECFIAMDDLGLYWKLGYCQCVFSTGRCDVYMYVTFVSSISS